MTTHKIVFSYMLVTPMCVLGSKQCGPDGVPHKTAFFGDLTCLQ